MEIKIAKQAGDEETEPAPLWHYKTKERGFLSPSRCVCVCVCVSILNQERHVHICVKQYKNRYSPTIWVLCMYYFIIVILLCIHVLIRIRVIYNFL